MTWSEGFTPGFASSVGKSARFTGLSSRKTSWSLLIVTTMRCCVISWTVLVFGTFTSMPDCSTGAVSMKITSSTSTTSTSGVMLISESDVRVAPLLAVKATRGLPFNRIFLGFERDFFQAVQQFAGEVIHPCPEVAGLCGKAVVGNHSRNGHKQSGCGGDQRFRNARSNSTQSRGTRCAQAVEGVHNAHHGSEQANKGSRRSNRGQRSKPLFH